MSKSLPARPNLEQLKNQAKELLKSHKSADPESLRRIQANHPRLAGIPLTDIGKAKFLLNHAQLVIAREYGFPTWAKLKERVETILLESADPMELFKQAFTKNDAATLRQLFARYPEIKAKINEPVAAFDSPAITHVRSREMLDVLLEAGADINARSRWWAGGFGLLDSAEPDLAAYAIQRGAVVDAHAAARLSMLDKLRELISANPALVHARGGDGQTPLHFASTVPIAELLLEHGADIDARDIDHESTPAQYLIRDRQDVARYLVRRGCHTDILMASALGDIELVRRHLDENPDCIHMRVTGEYFPMINHKAGGTIYQWTLGWYVSPHDVARQFGHNHVFELLIERSPADVKFIAACWAGDESALKAALQQNADLVSRLSAAYKRQVALAARNNNLAAVRLMLASGLPVDALGQHGATPLHWAAFHGNAEMAREILRYNPPLEQMDADFASTPLGWAIHGSEHGWYCKTGDYAGTAEALLKAGARPPEKVGGTEAVRAVLASHKS
ncbi:MAG TPA: ankyrin repeat domain-containing protein [Candidatus Limnocylindrales bacterium]|nr:ankyrin repeat domain-containing protein [Candidatus Limnocylindrales bacterium]